MNVSADSGGGRVRSNHAKLVFFSLRRRMILIHNSKDQCRKQANEGRKEKKKGKGRENCSENSARKGRCPKTTFPFYSRLYFYVLIPFFFFYIFCIQQGEIPSLFRCHCCADTRTSFHAIRLDVNQLRSVLSSRRPNRHRLLIFLERSELAAAGCHGDGVEAERALRVFDEGLNDGDGVVQQCLCLPRRDAVGAGARACVLFFILSVLKTRQSTLPKQMQDEAPQKNPTVVMP